MNADTYVYKMKRIRNLADHGWRDSLGSDEFWDVTVGYTLECSAQPVKCFVLS